MTTSPSVAKHASAAGGPVLLLRRDRNRPVGNRQTAKAVVREMSAFRAERGSRRRRRSQARSQEMSNQVHLTDCTFRLPPGNTEVRALSAAHEEDRARRDRMDELPLCDLEAAASPARVGSVAHWREVRAPVPMTALSWKQPTHVRLVTASALRSGSQRRIADEKAEAATRRTAHLTW